MNMKIMAMGFMVTASCMFNTQAFADQDYHQRTMMNRMSDWSVTLGKTPQERQKMIDQRVEMRAQVRQSKDQKVMRDERIGEKYDEKRDNLGAKNAMDKFASDRKAEMDLWQNKAEQMKIDLRNDRASVKEKIETKKEEVNRTFDKRIADLRYQYKDDVNQMNQKVDAAENDRIMKLADLDSQWSVKEQMFNDKETELKNRLNHEQDELNHKYEMKNESVK